MYFLKFYILCLLSLEALFDCWFPWKINYLFYDNNCILIHLFLFHFHFSFIILNLIYFLIYETINIKFIHPCEFFHKVYETMGIESQQIIKKINIMCKIKNAITYLSNLIIYIMGQECFLFFIIMIMWSVYTCNLDFLFSSMLTKNININIRWLKYVHIKKLDDTRTWNQSLQMRNACLS